MRDDIQLGDKVKQIKGRYKYQIGRIGTVVMGPRPRYNYVLVDWGKKVSTAVDLDKLIRYVTKENTDNETTSGETSGETLSHEIRAV